MAGCGDKDDVILQYVLPVSAFLMLRVLAVRPRILPLSFFTITWVIKDLNNVINNKKYLVTLDLFSVLNVCFKSHRTLAEQDMALHGDTPSSAVSPM